LRSSMSTHPCARSARRGDGGLRPCASG
jgi:hypothetical protein